VPAQHEYINESLRPLAVPIAGLTLDPKNARKHNQRNREATMASLRQSGQAKCIVVWRQTEEQGGRDIMIAGNGTVDAALALGWTHIAANVRTFDTEADAIAYGLADNRTAELAEWDYEELVGRFADLDAAGWGTAGLGWEDYELEPLMNAEFQTPDVDPDADPAGDDGKSEDAIGGEPAEVGGRNGVKAWKVLLSPDQKEELDTLLGPGWDGDDLVDAARTKTAAAREAASA